MELFFFRFFPHGGRSGGLPGLPFGHPGTPGRLRNSRRCHRLLGTVRFTLRLFTLVLYVENSSHRLWWKYILRKDFMLSRMLLGALLPVETLPAGWS